MEPVFYWFQKPQLLLVTSLIPFNVPRLLFLSWLLLCLINPSCLAKWQDNVEPKIRIDASKSDTLITSKFILAPTKANFKKVYRYNDNLLVGARNALYNLSLTNLVELKRINWETPVGDLASCKIKTSNDTRCNNFIRVIAVKDDESLFICGTNGLKPKCREYEQTPDGYQSIKEIVGFSLCPFDPDQNSSAIYVEPLKDKPENQIYAATPTDRAGSKYSVSRLPLQTGLSNRNQLNEPNFVSSLHLGEHVFFFFREDAIETSNCGKVVHSRVARVCTNDVGHPSFPNQWTSFLKARLDCSIPGKIPFQFSELQSTSDLVRGVYNGREHHVIYGVFTTPDNSLAASSICVYRMEDVNRNFDEGEFLYQENPNSVWRSVPESQVPSPRPGICSVQSNESAPNRVLFIRDRPFMAKPVTPMWKVPMIIQTNQKYRFTKVSVDSQVETVQGNHFDVLFIGTTDGRILKVINSASTAASGHENFNKSIPVIIDETLVFPNQAIINLLVYRSLYEAKLVVISDDKIVTLPLSTCEKRANSCGKCVALQDPYCAWDVTRSLCTMSRFRVWNRENFVQNVEEGWDSRCPDGRPAPVISVGNQDGTTPQTSEQTFPGASDQCPEKEQSFTAETLAFSVVTSVVSSLVIGFILGYIFSRRCKKEDPNMCSPYNDQRLYMDQRVRAPPGKTYNDMGPPPLNKPINLVLNVPPKSGKNANSSADNKPIQKVKKIYL